MFDLNNGDFQADTQEELLNNYVNYMFERDDYIVVDSISFETEIAGFFVERNFNDKEIFSFQMEVDTRLKELRSSC